MVGNTITATPQSNFAWVGFALTGQVLFALSNFLIACVGIESLEKAHAGYSSAAVRCLAAGLAGVLGASVMMLRGHRASLQAPARASCVAAAAGIFIGAGEYTFSYVLATSPQNAPFINAILPLNAVVVGLLSFAALGERMTWSQIIGLFIAISGLSMMGLANAASGGLDGLGFGLLTTALFGCMFFSMKIAGAWGAGPFAVIVRVWILYGFVGLCGLLVTCAELGECLPGLGVLQSDWTTGPQNRLYLFAATAGVSNVLAIASTKLALKMGPGGPVTAIVGSSSVLVFLLECAFFPKPHYKVMEIVGLSTAIAGVVLLSVGATAKSTKAGFEGLGPVQCESRAACDLEAS